METHPLTRFPLLPVEEVAFRVMTLEEFRQLVKAMQEPALAAMIAVMGETGIRKGEALRLRWEGVDLRNRRLIVERTKSRKVRHIPLSRFATEWLSQTTRYLDHPQVFVNTRTVQLLAGHADIKTTMRYAHLSPG